jgi:hypothetical protein
VFRILGVSHRRKGQNKQYRELGTHNETPES